MYAEDISLAAERLRDDLDDFRARLRKHYRLRTNRVHAKTYRGEAAKLAERWLVDLAADPTLKKALGADRVADLQIDFQRLLTCSERAEARSSYDKVLQSILRDYTARIVVPLKQLVATGQTEPEPTPAPNGVNSAFVGHSFLVQDKAVVNAVLGVLGVLGIEAVTGEKPRSERISNKVKTLIDDNPLFVGVYTRRDKIARKHEWTTSPWVIDEKAYAVAKGKRLILLREEGVGSIGGIQGDYEYLEFSRDSLELLVLRVLQMFMVKNTGLVGGRAT